MKKQTFIVGVLATILLPGMSGCATAKRHSGQASLGSVPVEVEAGQGVQADSVNLSPSQEGFYVHGRVSKQFGYSQRNAHVTVRLKDSNNNVRQELTTSINPQSIPFRRQAKPGVSHYIVNVPEKIETGDTIEVEVQAVSSKG